MTVDPAELPLVRVQGLTMAFGTEVVQHDLDFEIRRREVLAIVGASGCGKSTLLRHLIGLETPAAGRVLYGEHDLHQCDEDSLATLRRQFGVMFQAGALWSSMTVGENLMLPLRLFTPMGRKSREQHARYKLALVGLDGAFDLEPASLSGGMRKRAASPAHWRWTHCCCTWTSRPPGSTRSAPPDWTNSYSTCATTWAPPS